VRSKQDKTCNTLSPVPGTQKASRNDNFPLISRIIRNKCVPVYITYVT